MSAFCRACPILTAACLLALCGCSGESTRSDVPERNVEAIPPGEATAASTETLELPAPAAAREVPTYPSPEDWEAANERQAARASRSFEQLKQRRVPVYAGPLFVADDEQADLQTAENVAKRALILWAVELRAEGVEQAEVMKIIESHDLWDSVSPDEQRFLKDPNPDPHLARRLVWRLESIWVLLWTLGYIDALDWPSGMCDVPALVEIMKPQETNPAFISEAKLRSKSEILDAQDLTMRIHWSVRDAYLKGDTIPVDLDWSKDSQRLDVNESAAVGVVEQRHYVLNWLVNYPEPADWDDVDTPT